MVVTIHPMSQHDLKMVMKWAAQEGWNPGKYDHHSYYSMDPKGHFLLLVDNKPVGAISIVMYSQWFAFIGLFIVLPEHRSQGYGKKLWEHAMNYISETNTCGLYAVPQQVSRYQQSGFKEYYSNARWTRVSPEKPEDVTDLISETKDPSTILKKLCKYDGKVFGHDRKRFLKRMLELPQTCGFVSFNSVGKVNAYGIVRPCREGFRIGPLYAENFQSAQSICRILFAYVPGAKIIFDIPSTNAFGNMFAEYFDLEHLPISDTMAMFKGDDGPIENYQNKCYATASLEFG